ncbi:MAG TPA: carbamoyltransferase C-terminal domain-containing protein [Micromonosporaceae bacterium]|jgi:carbamoyltransferase
MNESPTVVGINRTQDGSIAIVGGRGAAFSVQKERFSRRKHHWGRLGDLPKHYLPHLPQLSGPIDLVVEGYSSDAEIENVEAYRAELLAHLDLAGAQLALVSHHLSHLYSAFYPSPFERAAGLVIDAQGSRLRDLTEAVDLPAGTPGDLLEISSFYRCERGRVQCLAKQLWSGDWSRPAGLGCFYSLLTKMLWPTGEGNEGKVMGLAPYGDPDADGLPDLDVRGHEVHIPQAWLRRFGEQERYRYFVDGGGDLQDCANLAAAGQRAFENALLRLVAWLHDRTGEEDLVFAGGVALNCSANGRILRESPFTGVFIPPSPHDGGTALGCALYGLVDLLGQRSDFRWENDFLGPEPDPAQIDAAVRQLNGEYLVQRPDDLAAAMVDLLAAGRVVALHHGRSESGPRALGNRSILADPRVAQMRDYINFKVKGREWFRPLAPLVLADHAARIFEVDRPAPFMQYAAQVNEPFRDQLPGITHVDDSARLQSVEAANTPFLHSLLTAWYGRTGCPVLINTSLNGPGDPLVETPDQAIDCLHRTGLHALAIPPWLIRKRDEPPVPGQSWSPQI